MLWSEIRKVYPNQWLVIEAIKAHTTADSHRILDEIAVIEICNDGNSAMHRYRQLHAQFPTKLLCLHLVRSGAIINLQEKCVEFAR